MLAVSLLPFLIISIVLFFQPAHLATAAGFFGRANDETRESQSFEKREAAYRANNIGVALLEQYKTREAVEEFRRALAIEPGLRLARINLTIALYYLPDAEGAKQQAERVLKDDGNAPQPHYILGLIERGQNRFDAAIAEFQNVLKVDPDDVGANINLGQIFVQQKRYAEAISAFRKATESEPYNETALYNLGLLLSRTGAKDEGRRFIQKFEQFRQSGAGTTLGTSYLEGGHYAEAVVSTGAEANLVDRKTPDVTFADVSDNLLPTSAANRAEKVDANARAQAIVLFDYDNDGDLDIFDASNTPRLLRNDGDKFTDVTAESGLSRVDSQYCFAAVAGDYDNDGKPDLFVVYSAGNRFVLYHNDGNGHFSDVTKTAGIKAPSAKGAPYLSAAFVDFDHDGDLDIIVTGPNTILFRNNGNGTFTDVTEAAGLSAHHSSAGSAIVPTDFDNHRDVDVFVLDQKNPPNLFRNMRDGTFRDVAKEVGLGDQGAFWCVAAGDVNKDGFTDFFMSNDKRAVFAMSDGHSRFKVSPAPAGMQPAITAQFLDYDNDGLLDLVAMTSGGLRLWRNLGNVFVDVSEKSFPLSFRNSVIANGSQGFYGRTALASGDLNGDGDTDLILRGPDGNLRILRNEGGNRNHSVKIDLHGRVSNKSAVESKIEIRAGSLWQKLETYSASPAPAPVDVIFGLGKRVTPDAVRVLWPAGIVQAETEFPTTAKGKLSLSLNITELDRKPSSCPYLYSWNGERFAFVTDFMGGGEMGYLEEPGQYNQPNPREYVRIRDDQLREKDGRFELRVTNELEEAMFVDRLQLLAVTHRVGTEVYPNEGMSDPPKPFKLFVTRGARPPRSAIDEHGRDVLDLISSIDRRWPEDFKLHRIRGYAEEHSLTMDLSGNEVPSAGNTGPNPAPPAKPSRSEHSKHNLRLDNQRIILLLNGWTDYAWSSDNVAAIQSGKSMKPPSLQVKDKNGRWRTVIKDIGIPVGRPQTVTVDLTGLFPGDDRQVRIVTNMRVYWDQILFATLEANKREQITRLDPVRADLHWRGFSAAVTPDGREPFGYDYQSVSFTSPWKTMRGRYTREGDVRELLLNTDDLFVICRPGDEISLSFDANSLPPLPAGWKRTFLLYSDGFSKEMDINSASPDQLEPLPFHRMSHYPYQWPEHYPLDRKHREYLERYNTRAIGSEVPRIEAELTWRR